MINGDCIFTRMHPEVERDHIALQGCVFMVSDKRETSPVLGLTPVLGDGLTLNSVCSFGCCDILGYETIGER